MLEASPHRPAVSRRTRVHADDIRRNVARQSKNWRDTLGEGATARNILFFVVIYPFLSLLPGLAFPQALYFLLAPAVALYFLWFANLKRRLPFRVPWDWHGPDYSTPKPGRPNEFAMAEGLVYLGRDQETMGELHITNSDARRHMFCLGTTGSGKALPVRARVLTPTGFRRIGDLVEGDLALRPNGAVARVAGVYPQGKRALVRILFQDGRFTDCDRDHLWKLRIDGDATSADPDGWRVMTAADLGMFVGVAPDRATRIPLVRRTGVEAFVFDNDWFAARAAADWTQIHPRAPVTDDNREAAIRAAREAQEAIWAFGGVCMLTHDADGAPSLRYRMPLDPARSDCDLGIIAVDPLEDEEECVCIKIEDDPDHPEWNGLFIVDNHIVTHNTEVLLGICAQPLMWASGFLFVDGKGTPPFYARVFSLAKRFGRQDDLRVINFMGAEGSDAPSGGASSQTNTMNPFARGTADQLTNLLISLMGDSGSSGDMWKGRAAQLISSAISVLVELRDSGDLLLDVQAIRDFLPLGKGVWRQQPAAAGAMGRRPPAAGGMENVTKEEWEAMKEKPGMIELYLRSLRGEFSQRSTLALKGFFDSLPGFIIDKAWSGQEQDGKTLEQYGYLSMQLTKPLGSLADDFGHIFRTPLGEVDMNDVVFQRRILVVLLPALQKAPDEIKNCGKIIVAMLKAMMGMASGDKIDGPRLQIIESSATKSSTPFVAVLDEVGYYMVDGIDIMMAQARSLNFCVIPAGQDLQAMKKGGSTVADSVSANARLTIIGATEDAKETRQFVMDKIGRGFVATTSGYQNQTGAFGGQYQDQMSVSFQETELVTLQELQGLQAGEFYMLFEGVVARCSTFYIGEDFGARSRVNKFLKVRSPSDRAPGLNQSEEIAFEKAWTSIYKTMRVAAQDSDESDGYDDDIDAHGAGDHLGEALKAFAQVPRDGLDEAAWKARRWTELTTSLCAAAYVGAHVEDLDDHNPAIEEIQQADERARQAALEQERALNALRAGGVMDPGMETEEEEEEGSSGGGPELRPVPARAQGEHGKADAGPDAAPLSDAERRGLGGLALSESLFASVIAPTQFAPDDKIAPALRPATFDPQGAPTPSREDFSTAMDGAAIPARRTPDEPDATLVPAPPAPARDSADRTRAAAPAPATPTVRQDQPATAAGKDEIDAPFDIRAPAPPRPVEPVRKSWNSQGAHSHGAPQGLKTAPQPLPAPSHEAFLAQISNYALEQDGRASIDNPAFKEIFRRRRKSEAARRIEQIAVALDENNPTDRQ